MQIDDLKKSTKLHVRVWSIFRCIAVGKRVKNILPESLLPRGPYHLYLEGGESSAWGVAGEEPPGGGLRRRKPEAPARAKVAGNRK